MCKLNVITDDFPCFPPQPEGGYTVTSPCCRKYYEGDSLSKRLQRADALSAVLELYA